MGRIFGPVVSRRLGRSLGIDVIPYKTCSFDCVYCECGKTTRLTIGREEFYPLPQILDELKARLSGMIEPPDVITLSGAGEPTLYSRMGELLAGMRAMTDIPLAVITNSSLLYRPDVREELMLSDIVVPSLDAVLPAEFARINRPHPGIRLDGILDGLRIFLDGYGGKVLIEILVVDGYNTGENHLAALEKALEGLRYDRIQLNTAVRPGTLPGVKPLSSPEMEKIRTRFGPRCEIVAAAAGKAEHEDESAMEHILSMIERRPCGAEEIGAAFGLGVPHVVKFLNAMTEKNLVTATSRGGIIFYTAVTRDGGGRE